MTPATTPRSNWYRRLMRSTSDRRLRRPIVVIRNGRDRRDVDVANLRRVVGYSALTITAAQAATATMAVRRGRRDYADAVWCPGLAAVAVVAALAGRGDARRRWGLAAVAVAWASRLEH